jgi:hypothetical protein
VSFGATNSPSPPYDRFKSDRFKSDRFKSDRFKSDRFKSDRFKSDRSAPGVLAPDPIHPQLRRATPAVSQLPYPETAATEWLFLSRKSHFARFRKRLYQL